MKYLLAIIIAASIPGCALFQRTPLTPAAYPQTTLTSTEDPATRAVTDRIVLTDKAPSIADFNSRVQRFIDEGGWKIVIPAYLNNLPSKEADGIYIVTLERVRPQ